MGACVLRIIGWLFWNPMGSFALNLADLVINALVRRIFRGE